MQEIVLQLKLSVSKTGFDKESESYSILQKLLVDIEKSYGEMFGPFKG